MKSTTGALIICFFHLCVLPFQLSTFILDSHGNTLDLRDTGIRTMFDFPVQ